MPTRATRLRTRPGVCSPASLSQLSIKPAMDIHDIALNLFAQLVHANGSQPLSQDARIAMGREAYRFAEAYIAAQDLYIRELPVANDQGF